MLYINYISVKLEIKERERDGEREKAIKAARG